jgi:hypothetical protein
MYKCNLNAKLNMIAQIKYKSSFSKSLEDTEEPNTQKSFLGVRKIIIQLFGHNKHTFKFLIRDVCIVIIISKT